MTTPTENENPVKLPPLGVKSIVRTTRQAINLTEHLICGKGARLTASEADGFSLAGRRAATLLSEEKSETHHVQPHACAPMVYHYEDKMENEQLEFSLPVELYASSAQDAVTHCLIAHEISATLGLPVLCVVDPQTAEIRDCVRLPTQKEIQSLSQNKKSREDVTKQQLFEHIFAAFKKFESTCFPSKPICYYSPRNLKRGHCIVTTGEKAEEARALADKLNELRIDCAVITVSLLVPFPKLEILELLKPFSSVLVFGKHFLAEQSYLYNSLRGALNEYQQSHGDRDDKQLQYIEVSPPGYLQQVAAFFNIPHLSIKDAITPSLIQSPYQLNIGVAPAGKLSFVLLMDIATYICKDSKIHTSKLSCEHKLVSAIKLSERFYTQNPEKLDLLFLSHPGLVEIEDILECLKPKGKLLIQGRSIDDISFWPLFSQEQRNFIEQNAIELYVIPGRLLGEYDTDDSNGSFIIHGSMLALMDSIACKKDLLNNIISSTTLEEHERQKIREGYMAVAPCNQTVESPIVYDPYFKPQNNLPHMQSHSNNNQENIDWRFAIRNFFITGQPHNAINHPLPGLSIRPAALNPYLLALEKHPHYPLLLHPKTDNNSPQTQPLAPFLAAQYPNSGRWQELAQKFIKFIEKQCSQETQVFNANNYILEKIPQFCANLNSDDQTFFYSSIEKCLSQLDKNTKILGLNEYTHLHLYVEAVKSSRATRIHDVAIEVKILITRLREELRIDDDYGPQSATKNALSSTLGAVGSEFFNTTELSVQLSHQPRGHKLHDPERMQRMRETLHILEDFIQKLDNSLDLILIHNETLPKNFTYTKVQVFQHPEPLRMASALFDALAENFVRVFKAMRLARLDVADAYDHEIHANILEQFSWQDLNPDELELFPVICVCEETTELYSSLSQFSRIMCSGRPLDVLALESTSSAMAYADDPKHSTYSPSFSYLATAYREAFVAQTTLARPDHLVHIFHKMNARLRAALTVISVPNWHWRIPPEVQLEAAHFGRFSPIFEYDPDAGKSAPERFSIRENPEPDATWPSVEIPYTNENGEQSLAHAAFTFAHALAIEPGYHQYFRILPNEAWNGELIELVDFLKNPTFDAPKIPFIWGVIDGNLKKCILTRDVTNACIDRMHRWKTLQELAGMTQDSTNNNADTMQKLEEKCTFSHYSAHYMEKNHQSIKQTLEQVQNLLQGLSTKLETSYQQPSDKAEPQDSRPEPEKPHPQVKPKTHTKPTVSTRKAPYIKTESCIACGACIAINDALFRFNDNMQAELMESDAASMDEIEHAAQNCPVDAIVAH